MKRLWKLILWLSVLCVALVVVDIIYIGVTEYYMYFTRSEAKAQSEAKRMFERICDRNGLNELSFHGPERDEKAVEADKRQDTYSFLWTREPDDVIAITITYLPYDLPYSISESILVHKPVQQQER